MAEASVRETLAYNPDFRRAVAAGMSGRELSERFHVGLTTAKDARALVRQAEPVSTVVEKAPDFETDKRADTFNWREACKAVRGMQDLAATASRSQDRGVIDFSHWERPLLVVPVSDWHFGSYGSDYKAIEEDTDLILNTPDLHICIIGDMLQMAIKMRNVLEMMDNALPPKLQFRFLESWLTEIQHKVLFSTWDNHSVMREEAVTGISHYAEIFSRKVIWFNGIGEPDVQVGKETYKLVVSHHFRGRSYLNPLHAQMRHLRMEAQEREIAIQGDTHIPGLMQYAESGKMRTVINCGSHQTNSGFAKRFFSLKTWQVFPCFALHHDAHKVVPFWSVADMLRAYGHA